MSPATQRSVSAAEVDLAAALRTLQMSQDTPDGLARSRIRMAGDHIASSLRHLAGLPASMDRPPAPELVRERDDFGSPAPPDDVCQLPPRERRSRELSRGHGK